MKRTLADSLMEEITRVRDRVMPAYLAIGEPGLFALTLMRADMDAAVKALAEQDGIECIRLYESLRSYTT